MVDLHDRTKQIYWNTPGAKTARNLIGAVTKKVGCTERQACKLIASRIELNHKYFYQIAGGYKNPGPDAMRKIEAYYARYTNKPAYKRRLVISFEDDEDEDYNNLKKLSNDQRKRGLLTHYRTLWLHDEID